MRHTEGTGPGAGGRGSGAGGRGPGVGGREPGAGGQGPGAGNSVSLGGQEAASTASGATTDGVAVGWVVVGFGFQVIEDSIGSP
jgi:hypothetical protein